MLNVHDKLLRRRFMVFIRFSKECVPNSTLSNRKRVLNGGIEIVRMDESEFFRCFVYF
jgi:hypothetical protein